MDYIRKGGRDPLEALGKFGSGVGSSALGAGVGGKMKTKLGVPEYADHSAYCGAGTSDSSYES